MTLIFRLRWRLLALTLIIAVPAFMLIYYANVEQRNSAAQVAQHDALGFVHLASEGQDRFIAETKALLASLARLPQVRPDQPESCNALLDNFRQDNPYTFIGLTTPTGDVVCGSPKPDSPTNVADRIYFQRA